MVMFHSYVSLPEGKQIQLQTKKTLDKCAEPEPGKPSATATLSWFNGGPISQWEALGFDFINPIAILD